MRSQNRKLLNQPLKSPSPDVGHRSIIVHTKSPVNQIFQYSKMRDNSQSPKRSNMSISFLDQNGIQYQAQIERLKNIIRELQSRLQPLQKIQISYGDLMSQNGKLRQEIMLLKEQLSQYQNNNQRPSQKSSISPSKFGYNNIVVPSPKASSNTPGMVTFNNQSLNYTSQNYQYQRPQSTFNGNNENILRQFNQRIFKLSQQNKRLTKILEEYKLKNDSLLLQNLKLKETANNGNNLSNNQLQRIKMYFNEQANRLVNQSRNKCEITIKNVESRLYNLEGAQNRINVSINTAKKQPYKPYSRTNSPFQTTKGNISTDAKTDFQDYHPAHVDMVQSKYTISPRQTKNFSIDSPIRQVEDESNRKEIQKLLIKIKNLQKDIEYLKRENTRLEALSKSRESQQSIKDKDTSKLSKLQKFYQEKAEGLQNQLRNKVAQLKFKQRAIEDLEKRLKDANSYIEKELPCYQKVIEQQKQKNYYYEDNLQRQVQKNKQYEQKNLFLNQELTEIRESLKFLQSKLQQKTVGNLTDFNELLKNYYIRIVSIRQNMSGQEIQLELKEVQEKYDIYSQLRNILQSLTNDYETLVQNYKREKLQYDSSIIELQRQNTMLKVQIQQVKIEKERLKDSIQAYKTPTKQASDTNYKKFLAEHQSKINDCKIRHFISDSVSKLTQLQRQIQRKIQGGKN